MAEADGCGWQLSTICCQFVRQVDDFLKSSCVKKVLEAVCLIDIEAETTASDKFSTWTTLDKLGPLLCTERSLDDVSAEWSSSLSTLATLKYNLMKTNHCLYVCSAVAEL